MTARWDAITEWATIQRWDGVGTVTYGTPDTYLGFETYAGNAQKFEVGAGTRQAPEARKGTH